MYGQNTEDTHVQEGMCKRMCKVGLGMCKGDVHPSEDGQEAYFYQLLAELIDLYMLLATCSSLGGPSKERR